MPNYSDIDIVAVLTVDGLLHKVDYKELANLPDSLKNPNKITIFGLSYDGSNEVNVNVPIATSQTIGCVKPVAKTSGMTGLVGIDSQGRLWFTVSQVDQVVTFGSSNAVSSNAVFEYGNNLADSTRGFIDREISTVLSDYNNKIDLVNSSISDTNNSLSQLTNRVQTNESSISSLKLYNTENDSKISEILSDISDIQTKNTEQDSSILQVQQNLDNKAEEINSTISSNKTELLEDYNSKIQAVLGQVDTNKSSIESVYTLVTNNTKDILTNKTNISKNSSDISTLQQRCTTIEGNVNTNKQNISSVATRVTANESNILTLTSRINTLSTLYESQNTAIKTLLSKVPGLFFNTEQEISLWLSNTENTKNLQIGAGLYLYNDNSTYYIWNGESALKFKHIEIPPEGYMVKSNPVGTGSISMNDCISGSNCAVFGTGNNAQGSNSLISGIGIKLGSDYSFGTGSYNQETDDGEVFTVGIGDSDSDRKTAMRIFNDGSQNLLDDIIIYSSNLGASGKPFVAKCKMEYYFKNIPENVAPVADYESFYQNISINESGIYTVTMKSGQWLFDDDKFRAVITDLSLIGITFRYTDGTSGTPSFDFVDNDSITIYAPKQPEVSLRNFYNYVMAMNLYVDEDGDVCQYES